VLLCLFQLRTGLNEPGEQAGIGFERSCKQAKRHRAGSLPIFIGMDWGFRPRRFDMSRLSTHF
jgi:hypothetical protein